MQYTIEKQSELIMALLASNILWDLKTSWQNDTKSDWPTTMSFTHKLTKRARNTQESQRNIKSWSKHDFFVYNSAALRVCTEKYTTIQFELQAQNVQAQPLQTCTKRLKYLLHIKIWCSKWQRKRKMHPSPPKTTIEQKQRQELIRATSA